MIYKDTDDVPSFLDLIEKEKYFLLDHFVDEVSGVDVTVYLTLS